MFKRPAFWLPTLFLLTVMFITNPKVDEHRTAVKDKLNQGLKRAITESKDGGVGVGLAAAFSGYFVNQIVDVNISRDNYLFFSFTHFHDQTDGDRILGVGIFGSVFLSSKMDKLFDPDSKPLKK